MKKMMIVFLMLTLFFINVSAKIRKIYHGDEQSNHIYLTFDDGYSAKNTEQILNILKEKNVPATFFVEGDFLSQNPILVNRITTEQTLGNHTFSHKDITKMSDVGFKEDLLKFEATAKKITGQINTKYFRPPMGKINDHKMSILESMGYQVFLWNVSYYDYVYYDDRGTDYAYRQLLKQTKNGSIILMHTLTKSNVNVLASAIDGLRNKGFVFSPLSELV